jgi:hypothetical protein
MSYELSVKIKDGVVEVFSAAPTVPDGTFRISGHHVSPDQGPEWSKIESLQVNFTDPDGQFVIGTSVNCKR